MRTRWKSIAAVVAAATAAFALAGHPAGATAPPTSEPGAPSTGTEGTITVTAEGTVRVEPDTAVITLGVQASAATGGEAMEQINDSSTALTQVLIDAGIPAEDIQTSGLSLFSMTDETGETTGYQASVNVSVVVRDIATVGSTIDAAQQAAGPGFTIGGVSFSFADPESVLEQARIDAFALAHSKAEQYAAAAGVTLGSVVNITEQSSSPPITFGNVEMAAAETEGPSISPGQLDLTVTVTVTYAITS